MYPQKKIVIDWLENMIHLDSCSTQGVRGSVTKKFVS